MSSSSYTPAPSHCLHSGYSHDVMKQWQSCDRITAENLVYPLFITDADDDCCEEVKSLPNQYRRGVNRIAEALDPLVDKGLVTVLVFGVISDANVKDERGTYATSANNPASRGISAIRQRYPDLCIIADVCLCAYTGHGHCGILREDGRIDNQSSIDRLAAVAVHYAKAGANIVAPSDMMDGRIGAIKHALYKEDMGSTVCVMSYGAKFQSVFYGPFRDAAKSGMKFGDRSLYQLPPLSRGLAMEAVKRDLAEGADMVMVKPGAAYMDIIRDTANITSRPVAVYQVSGEYAMLYHGAKAGAFDLRAAVMEYLGGMKRAGATILITYYTPDILDWLSE